MTRPGFGAWFNSVALRVFLFNLRELAFAIGASASLRLGPARELPLGFALELCLWRADGLSPHFGAELALGLVEVQAGIGSICADETPNGYQSKHLAKRGEPPYASYEGRWIWLKVARSW